MATKVIMPQMGESVAEGTVIKWLKKVGEKVERDEPLFEISTDKVDAEIPSPAAGTLTRILVPENQTVEVNAVVAEIDGEGSTAAEASASALEAAPAPPQAATAAGRDHEPAPAPALPVRTPVEYVFLAFAVSLLVGLASGLLPARKASAVDPVVAACTAARKREACRPDAGKGNRARRPNQ